MAKKQRLIKTLHNRGFVFVGEVGRSCSDGETKAEPGERSEPNTANGQTGPEKIANQEDIPRSAKIRRIGIVLGMLLAAFGLMVVGTYAVINLIDSREQSLAIPANRTDIPSIAVLPFIDLSPDGNQQHLADGIAEALLHSLTAIEGLKVTSRGSAFQFRGNETAATSIGRILDVGHVLEGSIRKGGSTVRISVQLVDTKRDTHLWSRTYDRTFDAENIIAIQDEIANDIADQLTGQLAIKKRVSTPRISSTRAYEAYLQANAFARKRTPEALMLSIDLYQTVIDLEPEYLPAYSGIVQALYLSDQHAGKERSSIKLQMEQKISEANRIDSSNPESLIASATLAAYNSEWKRALDLYDQALRHVPMNITALTGRATALDFLGRFPESLSATKKALLYDPLSPSILGKITYAYLRIGEIEKAYDASQKNLKWNSNSADTLRVAAQLEWEVGNYAKAHSLFIRSAALNPKEIYIHQNLANLYLNIGMVAKAKQTATLAGTKAIAAALLGDANAINTISPDNRDYGFVAYINGHQEQAYAYAREAVQNLDLVGAADIGMGELLWASEVVYTLDKSDDPRAAQILEKINQKIKSRPNGKTRSGTASVGVAASRILNNDLEDALRWLDVAIEDGHAYLYLHKRPIFSRLSEHPGYKSRLEKMRSNAAMHRQKIKSQLSALNGAS